MILNVANGHIITSDLYIEITKDIQMKKAESIEVR